MGRKLINLYNKVPAQQIWTPKRLIWPDTSATVCVCVCVCMCVCVCVCVWGVGGGGSLRCKGLLQLSSASVCGVHLIGWFSLWRAGFDYFLYLGLISGCLLLDSLISHLTTPEQCNCKAVYLHVLASNQVAVQFYENRRFYKFRYLPLYYSINGAHRDGHLYVLYINGGEPPWTFPYPFISILLIAPLLLFLPSF